MRPSWGCGRTQHRIFHIRRPSFARSFFDDLRLSRGKSMDRRTLRSRGLRAHILHSCRFHSPVSVPQAPRPLGSSRTLFGPFLEEMRAVFGCERSTGIYTAKIGFPLGRGVLQTLHRLLSLISLAALANLLQDAPPRCCARVFPRPRANRVSDCLTDSNGGHAGGKAVGGKPAVGPGRRLRQVRGGNRPCFGGCPATGKKRLGLRSAKTRKGRWVGAGEVGGTAGPVEITLPHLASRSSAPGPPEPRWPIAWWRKASLGPRRWLRDELLPGWEGRGPRT